MLAPQLSAWDIANLYLGSVNADLLGDSTASIVTLSQETLCERETFAYSCEAFKTGGLGGAPLGANFSVQPLEPPAPQSAP